MSIGIGPARMRPEMTSFYRQRNALYSTISRTDSLRSSILPSCDSSAQQRQAKREEFYRRIRERERMGEEATQPIPLLLSYLRKKANQRKYPMEGSTMVFTENSVSMRKADNPKNEKEDFLLDVMLTNSQIHIASLDTGSSLLLYLYKGSMILQKKPVDKHDYYFMNSSLDKVDLFIGDRRTQSLLWLSSNDIDRLNNPNFPPNLASLSNSPTGPFKRIIQDFSLALVTRSQNGLLPMKKSSPSMREHDLVNRMTVNIGAFSIRMTGDEFYRFLDVIRFTLLVNPIEQFANNRSFAATTSLPAGSNPMTTATITTAATTTTTTGVTNSADPSLQSEILKMSTTSPTTPNSSAGTTPSKTGKKPENTFVNDADATTATYLTPEDHKRIRAEVMTAAKVDSTMIPMLCVKYTLKKVEWTLLAADGRQIAVAML